MSQDYADVILAKIESPILGKVDLGDIAAKLKLTQQTPLTAVTTMHKSRKPRGFKAGTHQYSGELQVEILLDETVDWIRIQNAKEKILLTYTLGQGGNRYQVVGMTIDNADLDGDAEGGNMRTISFQFLDHKRAPSGLF